MSEGKGPAITVSIVSHGQGDLVATLLGDLARCGDVTNIIVTQNTPEPDIPLPDQTAASIRTIRNTSPLGFAANHNAAFGYCETSLFCVLNPDIRLPEDPFPVLLACLDDPDVAMVAPAVVNAHGTLEDSARSFPTPSGILIKAMGITDGRYAYRLGDPPQRPDWIAGMFLLVRSEAFRFLKGFDTGFHLYYEDVDFCVRLRKGGYDLRLCPSAQVVHDARRASHRNLRHMKWHLTSMVRYFTKHLGRLPGRAGVKGRILS